ncbi:Alpha N-terminal protein methyltransferase 1 [Vitis vinifera]|uniref:Alpha N-terminal protein methyltransferase 1 n=1 Tax=Vitis vinifera TaxID=29760 RepID=A0A438F909_VITVI|nr:Alpha N-terminal protein methyltransferase 1 [Vitis vinifera]
MKVIFEGLTEKQGGQRIQGDFFWEKNLENKWRRGSRVLGFQRRRTSNVFPEIRYKTVAASGEARNDNREALGESIRKQGRAKMEDDPHKKIDWYRKGVGYWEGVEASMNGMLGGYDHVSDVDVKGNEVFLKTLFFERYFNEVDLVEPTSHFLEAACETLASRKLMFSDMHKAANFYCVPLQDSTPKAGKYDVIWIQWCIGQLADDDFISFFKRVKFD